RRDPCPSDGPIHPEGRRNPDGRRRNPDGRRTTGGGRTEDRAEVRAEGRAEEGWRLGGSALDGLRCSVVSKLTDVPKRILIGRALRSDRLGETLLSKRVALPVVASDRQNVREYPSGGGDYEVANTNLGPRAGLTVASALLVDYVLTVAVSISAGIENLGSAIPFVVENKVACGIGVIVLLTLMNLRGVRESGTLFAIPTYVFVFGVFTMIAWGAFRSLVLGDDMRAPT